MRRLRVGNFVTPNSYIYTGRKGKHINKVSITFIYNTFSAVHRLKNTLHLYIIFAIKESK